MFCCFLRSTTGALKDILRCSLRVSGSHSKVSRVIYNGAGVEGKIPRGPEECVVADNVKAVLRFTMFKGSFGNLGRVHKFGRRFKGLSENNRVEKN